MAQPSGQVLLDPAKPNYAATSFWYCDGSGLWDAKAGATLAKTGSAGTAVEGGANVVLGNGSTYYALASALSLAGAYTLMFRARTTTAGSTASMICGSRSDTANFVWLASSGTQMTVRAGNDSRQLANSASNVMATYALSRSAGGTLSLYKNGAFVASGPQVTTLLINHILSGYTGTSFILNGALEFLHIIDGVALDATAVSSYYSDPYQDLQASAVEVDGSAAISRSISVYASGSKSVAREILAAAADSITLNSPADYQTRQRNLVSNTAALTVSGTYTGSPASIEYRFAGSTWATLVASPSGGAFSTSVTLPTGQGAFEVRFSNATGVTDSAAYVTVGDVFIVAGQSNHAGRSPVKVDPVFTNFVVPKLGRDFVWKPLTEATTVSGSFDEAASAAGSYIGALSTRLQSVGVPVAFCPVAQGSTYINDWARYDADPTNPYNLYGDARQADIAAGGNRSMLWLQGEGDAQNGMPQATHETKLNDLVSDWQSDTGGKVFVIQIVRWSSSIYSQIDAIRAAQAAVAATNPAVAGIADGNVASWQAANNVHYSTAQQINDLADAVSAGMVEAFYTAYASTTANFARSLRAYASATASLGRSVRNLAAVSAGVARSVRGYSSAAAGIARGIRNHVTTPKFAARSVRAWAAGAAAIARTVDAAGYAAGAATVSRSVRAFALSAAIVARSIEASATVSAATTIARQVRGYASRITYLSRTLGDAVQLVTTKGYTARLVRKNYRAKL